MLKLGQSTYMLDFIKKENMTNCKSINISIKIGLIINIKEPNNYKKTNFKSYQKLINKPIYLFYGTCLNIIFVIN